MNTQIRNQSFVAALSVALFAGSSLAAPAPGGGGFRGGGGGAHPSGGGAPHPSGGGGGGAPHISGGGGGGTPHIGAGGGGGAPHISGGGGTPHISAGGGGGAPHISGGGGGASFHPATVPHAGPATTTFSHSAPTFTHTSPTLSHTTTTFSHTGTPGFSRTPTTFPTGKLASGGVHVGAGPAIGPHPGAIHSPGAGAFAHHPVGGAAFVHTPGAIHPVNAHVYNQMYFGNHALHLAGAGYYPSYYHHPWYHGPWSGNAWGWGWGLGPGLGFGFGGGGWGIGIGSGWGYGGYGGYGYPYGPYGYWGRPLGWGFGGWGLGGLAYNSGYYPYYNPYYVPVVNQPIVYNYSTPIPVATQDPGVAVADTAADEPPPVPQSDNPDFDAAREAFKVGDYGAALASVDAAIAKVSTDAVLHEFRALVLFAMQNFQQAAGVIHSLLAVGPGWDWTTMSSLYADPDIYTQQLRVLEDYTLAHPKAADAHFLLAYHYTICSHSDAAAAQLQQVVRLMPSDRLAGELLQMIQGPPKQTEPSEPPAPGAQSASTTPSDEGPQPDPIDKDLLPGSWRSARNDGSKFELKLTDDGNFTWKFSPPKQKGEEFGGTYTVDGPVLALERKEGGALAGVVTFDGNSKFNFRMVGAPPQDKGLDFSK